MSPAVAGGDSGSGSAFGDLDRPPLDGTALRQALVGPGTWWRRVEVCAQSPSTNAELADLARQEAPEGTLVTTDHQVAGRGRLGRGWESPARSGIAASVLLRPDHVPSERWSWLPLLVGIATVEAVRISTGVDAALKWPNDVVVEDRKLAGILLERIETPAGPAAVAGLGLNVSLREDELPVAHATSLLLCGASTTDRAVVLRAYARVLEALYRAWAATDGDPAAGLHDSYVRRCVTLDQDIVVTASDGAVLRGNAQAIDASGRLVLSVDGRHHRAIGAGDVVHVRART